MRPRTMIGAVLFVALCEGWGREDGDDWERLVLEGCLWPKPDQTQNQYLGRTLRSNVKRSALTFYQEEFTFFSDQPNSLILKWNEISGTTGVVRQYSLLG
jgi:hypothetical protein